MTSLDRTVSQLMQREVVTLRESDHLDAAEDIMRLGYIRHVPVLDGDRLVGIVSHRDLLAASLSTAIEFEASNRRSFLRAVGIAEVMTREVETVGPDTRADEAGRMMLDLKVGCLPVVDESGVLLGVVSETDLLAAALGVSEAVDAGPGRFDAELETLARVRDELRVQLHLGKAEAKELWDQLEHRFVEAEARTKSVAEGAKEPIHEMGEAAQHLLEELRRGYQRLRKLL